MSGTKIRNHCELMILPKEQVTLPIKKLIRTLNKRPEKKRFLLVEHGCPADNRVDAKRAVLKLRNFSFDKEGNLRGSVIAADRERANIDFGDRKISIGQVLLSQPICMFGFKVKTFKRPVLRDDQFVIGENGKPEFFKNCLFYIETLQDPILLARNLTYS